MFMEKVWTAKLVEKKTVAEGTFEITIELADPEFRFKAGQYIWLELPKLKYEDPRGTRRAFSICSSSSQPNRISVLFRASDSGYKRSLLELNDGSGVIVRGPFGYLDWPEDKNIPVVLVSGGVGVAPFMSMIRNALENGDTRSITLLYANPSNEKAAYKLELTDLSSKFENFAVSYITGEVNWDAISKATAEPSAVIWYVIGPERMVRGVAKLLYEHGVSEKNLRFEEYYVSPDSLNSAVEDIWKTVEIFKLAVEDSFNHIIMTDLNGIIVFANAGAEKITGYMKSEMIGQTPRLWGGLMDKAFYEKMWKIIKIEKRPFEGEIKNRKKSGEFYQTITRISPIFDSTNTLVGYMGTEEDISARVKLEEDLKTKVAELKKMNEFMVGRELEMQSLKEQIAKLELGTQKLKGGG
jgi:PAS domain S-box-containing protein